MEEPKVILITGGSSGIGFDAAERLGKEGHRVYAAARRVAKMDPLVASGVTPLALDVTDESSCKACVEAVLAAEGRIDVLVNAAGYGSFGPLEAVPESEARRQMEVNLIGLSRMCSLVIPSMRERGSGRIINIASVAGRAVLYFGGWYNVSKYGVEAFSDALRMEAKPFGIRELIARIKANIRRASLTLGAEIDKAEPSIRSFGEIVIDMNRYEIKKNDEIINLTLREFELLRYLAANADKVFDREDLLKNVWGYEYYGDIRTVDVTVRRLREKIEDEPGNPKYIMTRRGVGYYFRTPSGTENK